jgi:thiol-disulfide isomerase/thioredoxin
VTTSRTRTAWLLAAVFLVAGSPSSAETVSMRLTGHFQLQVDGKLEPKAKVYQSGGAPRLVIVVPGVERPLLLTAGTQEVEPLDAGAVVADPHDASLVRVDVAGRSGSAIPVRVDGPRLEVRTGSTMLVVEPRAPMLGDLRAEELLQALPEYRFNAAAYEPKEQELRRLDKLATPTEVDVFFGSWCPHCEQMVPRLLRVLQELHGRQLHVRFHGLPHEMDDDDVARRNQIHSIPTAIVRQGGKEVGRMEEEGWISPEATLALLLVDHAGGS